MLLLYLKYGLQLSARLFPGSYFTLLECNTCKSLLWTDASFYKVCVYQGLATFDINTGTLAPQCSSLYVCPDFMCLTDSSRRSAVAAVPPTLSTMATPKLGHPSLPGHKSLALCFWRTVLRALYAVRMLSGVKCHFETQQRESNNRAVSRCDKLRCGLSFGLASLHYVYEMFRCFEMCSMDGMKFQVYWKWFCILCHNLTLRYW